MDKNAIKKYAIWAREELIKRVSTKAQEYGISADGEIAENVDSIDDKVFSATEKQQRARLIAIVKKDGFEHAMEEAAYTWFNRFIALRFMEVNGYLPSRVRVFTDEENNFKPQILAEALHLELDGIDLDKVMTLKSENKTDELYKYLIITQCNALHGILPKMFPPIDDYTQMLFPDNILREGSAIEQLVTMIPEEDWQDAVQILGWLYQYYNSVPKEIVFANLKKNIKITKENIPAATQLFTPDWIVRYMVENSLGRIAVDRFGVDPVAMGWKYYLAEAEQTEEVQAQLKIINSEKTTLEELKVIDPCMGSGHILVYAFDVLVQIYESQGYVARDAVSSILQNNLFGLDIDERAYQLAYFAVMMKARSADRRFFSRGIAPQLYCPRGYAEGEEYGSLLNVSTLEQKPEESEELSLFNEDYESQLNIWNFRRLLNQKYDVVVTNPPYMGTSSASPKLIDFVKKNYPDSKSDMFAIFIERTLELAKKNGYSAMITQHAFMFLSSYEKLRVKLLQVDFINMAHLGARAFEEIGGEVVQTASWVMRKSKVAGYQGRYKRLVDFNSQNAKDEAFLAEGNLHTATQENFSKIPGSPIAYWVSENFMNILSQDEIIGKNYSTGSGLSTADNERFLRFFWEVKSNEISQTQTTVKKWCFFHKGGEYRKWYGNLYYVVNWKNDGEEIKYWVTHNPSDPNTKSWSRRIFNTHLYFKLGITWSVISSGDISFRTTDTNAMISNAAGGIFGFSDETSRNMLMTALNAKIWTRIFKIINPTLNYSSGVIQKAPTPQLIDTKLGDECVEISKTDWDSFETSWDFAKHPLLRVKTNTWWGEDVDDPKQYKLEDSYRLWEGFCDARFKKLKSNEEELNRIFIEIYGLQDELTPEVEDKDVTVRLADKTRDVKSFISYAVGCMFGRYSLDIDGLVYAGGAFDDSKYTSFIPDKDNIIPICDDEYFEDDIVGRLIDFVKVVYGDATLEENLQFIADALGGKGTARDAIRGYFLNGFYADHCKVYQKRPIYWLFDSGKKNGFKALVYMHRYEQDTIARMRTDYVHEQQGRYRTAIADLERRIPDVTASERVKLNKALAAMNDQATEIRLFEEKIHHLADQMIRIDLDDGVKHNYEIFKDVLAKIK